MFELYGKELYQFSYLSVGNTSDAEDVIQEVFIGVLRSWEKFEHRSSERTWIWSITKNCIKDYYRRQRRYSQSLTRSKDETSFHASSYNDTLQIDLQMALDQLSLQQKQVFLLRIVHDYSIKESSEILGWSEIKVRVTLHRAIKAVKKVVLDTSGEGETLWI